MVSIYGGNAWKVLKIETSHSRNFDLIVLETELILNNIQFPILPPPQYPFNLFTKKKYKINLNKYSILSLNYNVID
jgi:hypothetical protein